MYTGQLWQFEEFKSRFGGTFKNQVWSSNKEWILPSEGSMGYIKEKRGDMVLGIENNATRSGTNVIEQKIDLISAQVESVLQPAHYTSPCGLHYWAGRAARCTTAIHDVTVYDCR